MDLGVTYDRIRAPHAFTRHAGFPLWTVGAMIEGRVKVTWGETIYETGPGNVAVVRPGTQYHVATADGYTHHAECYAILTMPAEWERWFENWPSPMPGVHLVHVSDEPAWSEVVRSFRAACDAASSGRRMALQLAGNLVERVLILSNEHAAESDKPGDRRIANAMHYAANNLREPLSIPVLADAAGVSRSRFSHLFKSVCGEPPMHFVEGLRIKRAQMLLLTTLKPVNQIARAVGFASPFHFSDRFRARVGQSPSEYRARPRA